VFAGNLSQFEFLGYDGELNFPTRVAFATRGRPMQFYLGFEIMLAATVIIGAFAAFWIART
jgi:hypothetical protein